MATFVLCLSGLIDLLQVLSIEGYCRITYSKASHEEVHLLVSATSTTGFLNYHSIGCLNQNDFQIPVVRTCRKMQQLRSLTVISIDVASLLLQLAYLAFLWLSIGPMEVGILTIGNIARRLTLHRSKTNGRLNTSQNLLRPVWRSTTYLENTLWTWTLCDV